MFTFEFSPPSELKLILMRYAPALSVEDLGSFFSGSAQAYGSFTESAIKAMPYLAAVAVIAAAAAIILLMLDVRTKKHTSKIAGAVVCIVLSVVFALLSKAVMK